MNKLQNTLSLIVKQKKEWGEILTGFETRNRYVVSDETGNEIYAVGEESSFLTRTFLGSWRPFTLQVVSLERNMPVLQFDKPFNFILHKISIFDHSGKMFGRIQQKFAVLSRRFVVFDASGTEICKIYGPLLHPWTFRILKGDAEVGKITKRWSGMGKEIFTDADNFNVSFPPDATVEQKSILLGALFLIDMLYFERSKK